MTGQQIRRMRKELDLSQEDLAKKLGLNRRTIIRWENGEIEIGKVEEIALTAIAQERA